MRTGLNDTFHLTYCTNIHPAADWHESLCNLKQYVPALKRSLAPDKPFGLGLRISGLESKQLLEGNNLQELATFLHSNDLYVFTINGFPYGPFHKQPVKEKVHAPDWLDDERVSYTQRLATILAALLPAGTEGSISTSPLSYKRWVHLDDETVWQQFTSNMLRVVQTLIQLYEQQGKLIHLDIEPEPDGVLENSEEVVAFFRNWLLTQGVRILTDELNVSADKAREYILRHVRVCFDTCHVALVYEEPKEVLARYKEESIRVGKVQVSSALKLFLPPNMAIRNTFRQDLQAFTESTYLHQVIQRNRDGSLCHFPDLPDALNNIHDPNAAEWRIHFHVPIFMEEYGAFCSTQDTILKTVECLYNTQDCQHFEVETYTWDVLPQGLRGNLLESINRELEWVVNVFDNA